MYFAMKSIGNENEEKIKSIAHESDRWKFLYDIAKAYGFEGIQIGSNIGTDLYVEEFKLDLNNIPDYFGDLKFTLHLGGHNGFTNEKDCEAFDKKLESAFKIAAKHNFHDISIHPPVDAEGFTPDKRKISEEYFDKTIMPWEKEALRSNISLSMESHDYGVYFLFDGLHEYERFIDKHPDLGVLIDISHNYYDNYSEDEIINILGDKNVKGLHISDALRNVDVRKGTHLAIGDGTVDFSKLLNHFKDVLNLYGALEIVTNNDGISSNLRALRNIVT
ncbi:MAG: sugar phosphate isomerase/epimerase [Oscillospiraceae bacterium]|nr:sugar phosphate isomerase/epimerase [Oscillospiraceae bacterium]